MTKRCERCRGYGYVPVVMDTVERCKECEGYGTIPWPNDWRPHEPVKREDYGSLLRGKHK